MISCTENSEQYLYFLRRNQLQINESRLDLIEIKDCNTYSPMKIYKKVKFRILERKFKI